MILGISGAPMNGRSRLPETFFHDAAAALVGDQTVIAAIEEERISRQKHSNAFPAGAIMSCLQAAGVHAGEIEGFAYYFEERQSNLMLRRALTDLRCNESRDVRTLLACSLTHVLGTDCPVQSIHFVRHHDAHCAAAIAAAPFDNCLSMVVDGMGEAESISVYDTVDRTLSLVGSYPISDSLGFFFAQVTKLLGFGTFDEYKVMGLAPYGDRDRFGNKFRCLFRFEPDGSYTLDNIGLLSFAIECGLPPRTPGDQILQVHKDFAAAAQDLLETAMQSLLRHWSAKTGRQNLCLSGGVAQNCAMNGAVARSRQFDAIYVHPASHDAGAAIGAAILAAPKHNARIRRQPFSPFAGWPIGVDGSSMRSVLEPWRPILQWENPPDLHGFVAEKIVEGKIVGIVRGRAEFGPRALGARSIIADPRPVTNRQRINNAIKRREDFRPFAPAVMEACAAEWFDLPKTLCNLGEMCFVVPVHKHCRDILAAVTHIDGTARIQIVSRQTNPDFHMFLEAFERCSGIGVLVNTSFNNNWEPIVNTHRDAVLTFLTSDIDILVLDDWVITKSCAPMTALRCARVCLSPDAVLSVATDGRQTRASVSRANYSYPVSESLAKLLATNAGRERTVSVECAAPETDPMAQELYALWERRVIEIEPAS